MIVNVAADELRRPALRSPSCARTRPRGTCRSWPWSIRTTGRGWSRRWRSASTTSCRGRSIREELAARARTQIQRKRYTDFLRDKLDHSLELAVTDQLTGLHNRRYMAGPAAGPGAARAAQGGEPVAVLVIDIDHFKKINDSFGHDVGDEVLREFAVRLATNVRAIDLPCRYGGEEFVVVMPDTKLEDAHRIAERIRRRRGLAPFRVMGGQELLTVTISIGVAATLGAGDTPDALLKRADEGVYEAKADGPRTRSSRGRPKLQTAKRPAVADRAFGNQRGVSLT